MFGRHVWTCFTQTKGYAEGAGDSLAGGLKKNVHKVTGNDAKQAEGELLFPQVASFDKHSCCSCVC